MVNLVPRTVGSFNLLLQLTPIMSFLPCWRHSPLCESRLKLLHLCHVVPIRTHLSLSCMIRSWIFWTSKNKPRLGFNLFMPLIRFSQMYSSCSFFQGIYWSFKKCIFNLFLFFSRSTIHLPDMACIFVVWVGTYRTFYFQEIQKATPIVDLVI